MGRSSSGKWDKEAEVVVLGFGAAGSVAAIEAHDAGADVLIIEAMAHGGGSCRKSGGIIYGCDTSIQKSAGISDSPEEMYKYNMAIGEGLAEPDQARIWSENSGKLIDWLIELGVKFMGPSFSGAEKLYSTVAKPAPRGHIAQGEGAGLWNVLEKNVIDRGIECVFKTRGSELIGTPSRGETEILGIKAESKGDIVNIKAGKAVILCAGGYCTNPEFLKKFASKTFPSEPNPMMVYDNGDGIAMAHAFGADFFSIDNIGLRTLILRGWPKGFASYVRHPPKGGYIWVNLKGERFVDEATFYGKVSTIVGMQPEARCYVIFDEVSRRMGGSNLGWRFSDDLSKEIEVGSIKKGGTIEELARTIGVDSEGLVNTVSNWNRNTLKGEDPDFDRSVVAPINNPPYYAGYVKNYVGSNYGGLKIDTKCNVIHISGKVIPRLYAAGSNSGGCIGKLHLGGGTLLSKSMTFGRIAGMNAANKISW